MSSRETELTPGGGRTWHKIDSKQHDDRIALEMWDRRSR